MDHTHLLLGAKLTALEEEVGALLPVKEINCFRYTKNIADFWLIGVLFWITLHPKIAVFFGNFCIQLTSKHQYLALSFDSCPKKSIFESNIAN